jgi:predicted nucleotidyltransferase
MTRTQALAVLKRHEVDLRRRGVRHAALFGSVARDAARPDSDVDVLVELDPDAPIGVFEYADLTLFLSGLFAGRADVANRASLKAHVRPAAERDAVYAF